MITDLVQHSSKQNGGAKRDQAEIQLRNQGFKCLNHGKKFWKYIQPLLLAPSGEFISYFDAVMPFAVNVHQVRSMSLRHK